MRSTSPSDDAELVRELRATFDSLGRAAPGAIVSPGPCPPEDPRTRLPSLPGDRLTAPAVRAGILRRGSVLVRGLLSRQRAESLRSCVDLAFDARARIHAGDGSAAADAWYHELADVRDVATRTFVAADGVLAADSPRGLRELLAAYAEVGVDELVAGYLGERPAFSFEKTALRRVPPAPATSWHQDGAFLGGAGIRSLNVWVALSSCGRTSPGLEILPRRVEHIVRLGGMFDWDIADETLAREFPGEPPVLIEFEPGDALLFDHLCVHRTGQIRGMTEPRYALESWFFSPSRFPEVLTGLLW